MIHPTSFLVRQDRVFWTFIVAIVLCAAYGPTILHEYVPQDQWRAFRYGLAPTTSEIRFKDCYYTIFHYYFLTGRWLVWPGECVEHALVSRISDLSILRAVVLAFVGVSVFAFQRILMRNLALTQGVALAAGVALAFAPGYAFMFYQGLTGMPVLAALLMGFLSFHMTASELRRGRQGGMAHMAQVAAGMVLFILACLIYPAFAFVIVPLCFMHAVFLEGEPPGRRIGRAAGLGLCYFLASMIYMGLLGLTPVLAPYVGVEPFDLGPYNTTPQIDPAVLYQRAQWVWQYLADMPLGGFRNLSVWISLPVLLSPALVLALDGWRLGWGPAKCVLAGGIYIMAVPAVIIGSVSPWVFSHMDGLAFRHTLAVDFLLILSLAVLAERPIRSFCASTKFHTRTAGLAGSALLVAAICILYVRQYTVSQREVANSTAEIGLMRRAYERLALNPGIFELGEIHIVRPPMIGIDFIGERIYGEYLPASMAHPEHMFQLTHAVLREVLTKEQMGRLRLADCRFDRGCAHSAPNGVLVISQGRSGDSLPTLREPHAVVDYSILVPESPR